MPRIHTVTSSLKSPDKEVPALLLRRMEVRESLGTPFEYEVDLLSTIGNFDVDEVLGNPLVITVEVDERKRHFHGIACSVASRGNVADYAAYRVIVRPWFWLLTKTNNCRIFQNKSVPDIFSAVCKDTHGLSDFKKSLSGQYKAREYCVQYRESDFAFLSRLLEEEGIYYFFEHSENKHTLVLADSYGAHKKIEGDAKIPFRPPGQAVVGLEHVSGWHVLHEVQTTKYVLNDYDFTKPKADLESKNQVSRKHGYAKFETYDYPGRYLEAKDGDSFAKFRLEELQARQQRFLASSDHHGLVCGGLFELTEYPDKQQNAEYLITSTEIEVISNETEQFNANVENRFTVAAALIPSRTPFRAERRIPWPVVQGPQTAVVVGKPGEEIWTDEHGRVKVQFHWDREGKKDEKSSCWIRVAHGWAGKSWGAIQIPRIGHEVIVEFLEGDPDRPIITGSVYNGDNRPPYSLPNNQTQSGLLTRSSKQGTGGNASELRFEDKKGEEEIYFHAEKDFKRVVENDDTLTVGLEKKDKGCQKITIWKDRTVQIKTGTDSLKADAGEINIEAAKSITLKVGGSTIQVKPDGITIKAPQVTITGDAKVEASATITKINGSATLALSGGIVKIN